MIGVIPQIRQLVKRIRGLRRDAVVAELDQHISCAFDDVTSGMGERVLQIVVRKVKVASQAQFRRIADELLQMRDQPLQIFAIIVVTVVGVGRGDHVSDAVSRRRAAHGDRDVPGFRSVVYFRQDVRVNVDHSCSNPSSPAKAALP